MPKPLINIDPQKPPQNFQDSLFLKGKSDEDNLFTAANNFP
jgi:hypothetical protein